MLRDITIGQFYPVKSTIHKLDPRTKLLATVLFVMALFSIHDLRVYGLVITYFMTVVKLSKIPLKFILRGLKPVMLIITFTVGINIFMTDGIPIFEYKFISITMEGIKMAVFMGMRLVFLIVGTSILTLSTTPIELTDAIERLLTPFSRFGVPAHELAMMMTIALRFIPTLLDETDKIMKAQMARGANLDSGNLISRARNLIPILVPLFINAFRRADELAIAMESRCYRGGENRTRLKTLKFEKIDIFGFVIPILFFVMIIGIRFLG